MLTLGVGVDTLYEGPTGLLTRIDEEAEELTTTTGGALELGVIGTGDVMRVLALGIGVDTLYEVPIGVLIRIDGEAKELTTTGGVLELGVVGAGAEVETVPLTAVYDGTGVETEGTLYNGGGNVGPDDLVVGNGTDADGVR